MKHLQSHSCQSPAGEILMLTAGERLCYLDFAGNDARLDKLLSARYGAYSITPAAADPLHLAARLKRYFAGEWDAFDGLQLSAGGTEFQRRVWRQLRRIPAGEAIAYKQLAREVNKPAAVRAAAGANARNPIAIVIPCHRVINADGGLGGYAGGVERKRWLLAHEGVAVKGKGGRD